MKKKSSRKGPTNDVAQISDAMVERAMRAYVARAAKSGRFRFVVDHLGGSWSAFSASDKREYRLNMRAALKAVWPKPKRPTSRTASRRGASR